MALCQHAYAFGEREQGALVGLGLGLILRGQPQAIQQPHPVVIYAPNPQQPICGYNIYCGEPHKVYVPTCHIEQQVDYYGRVVRTYQVCR